MEIYISFLARLRYLGANIFETPAKMQILSTARTNNIANKRSYILNVTFVDFRLRQRNIRRLTFR